MTGLDVVSGRASKEEAFRKQIESAAKAEPNGEARLSPNGLDQADRFAEFFAPIFFFKDSICKFYSELFNWNI